jgi:hypothetical protein
VYLVGASVGFLTAGLQNTVHNIVMISDFRRDVDEICALLRYYATLSGSSVPTFRDNLSDPSSWTS